MWTHLLVLGLVSSALFGPLLCSVCLFCPLVALRFTAGTCLNWTCSRTEAVWALISEGLINSKSHWAQVDSVWGALCVHVEELHDHACTCLSAHVTYITQTVSAHTELESPSQPGEQLAPSSSCTSTLSFIPGETFCFITRVCSHHTLCQYCVHMFLLSYHQNIHRRVQIYEDVIKEASGTFRPNRKSISDCFDQPVDRIKYMCTKLYLLFTT